MFRTVPLSIIRSFSLYIQQWCMSYRMRTELQFRPDPARKLSANLYDIPLLCVQWKTPDDGHRNCPKHVEFYPKNKFEKLVHLVGFIIWIYHDARSPESQIPVQSFFAACPAGSTLLITLVYCYNETIKLVDPRTNCLLQYASWQSYMQSIKEWDGWKKLKCSYCPLTIQCVKQSSFCGLCGIFCLYVVLQNTTLC